MNLIPVGVDISQLTFDACVKPDQKHKFKQFQNLLSGFEQLQTWLSGLFGAEQRFHVCMEATGAHWEALADYLHHRGHTVSVVNPARIKGHAQSLALRHKSDKLDSQVNWDYCATQTPDPWHPPAAEIKALRALVRRRDDLVQMQTMETNRLKSGLSDPLVKASLQQSLAWFKQQLKQIQTHINTLVKQHALLAHQIMLLGTIKGIGRQTAIRILAESLDITQFSDARAMAASIGITPVRRSSGTSLDAPARISKLGNSDYRASLWWPTITAMRLNPVILAFAKKLRAKHKKGTAIIIACMHKLVRLAYGVIHNDAPFDPLWATLHP